MSCLVGAPSSGIAWSVVMDELSVEERSLLSLAYKNAVGSRRAAWHIITSVEQREKTKGSAEQAR